MARGVAGSPAACSRVWPNAWITSRAPSYAACWHTADSAATIPRVAVGIPFSRQRSARRGPGDESRPRPDLPIGADLLPQIGHIVVLMMENHSYDNYFGMLGKGDGLPLGPDGRPTAVNVGADGHAVRAWHLDTTRQVKNVPTQGWYASHLQYGDGRNDGFVRSAEEAVDGGAAHSALTMG